MYIFIRALPGFLVFEMTLVTVSEFFSVGTRVFVPKLAFHNNKHVSLSSTLLAHPSARETVMVIFMLY